MNISAAMATCFRFRRSIHTPAKGPRKIWGRNATRPDNAIIMGEPVSLASHQISENWTAELPIRETVWPAAMVRNFCFHLE